jgi:hypothetical protein
MARQNPADGLKPLPDPSGDVFIHASQSSSANVARMTIGRGIDAGECAQSLHHDRALTASVSVSLRTIRTPRANNRRASLVSREAVRPT